MQTQYRGYPQFNTGNTSGQNQQTLEQLQQKLAEVQQLQNQIRNNVYPMPGVSPQPLPPIPGPPPEDFLSRLPPETRMIIRLFEEYRLTEEGKQLAAYIDKFSLFCQVKLNPPKEEPCAATPEVLPEQPQE